MADVAGLRAQFVRGTAEEGRGALLPFLWGTVAKSGQVFGDRSRGAPSRSTNGLKFSYPGYSEIFCGFADPRIDSNAKLPNPNGSVLEFLDASPAFRGRVSIVGSWDVFPFIFRTSRNRLSIHAGWDPIPDDPPTERIRLANLMRERLPRYWPDNAFDAITLESARDHLVRRRPRVLYVALGETDEWAHGRRYDLYLKSAWAADAAIGEIWATIQGMPQYAGTTALLLTTDHGRGSTKADWTSHGRGVDGAEDIWIAAMGPGIPPLGVRSGVETTQSQVAATIAALLGEDFLAESPRSAPPLPFADGADARSAAGAR